MGALIFDEFPTLDDLTLEVEAVGVDVVHLDVPAAALGRPTMPADRVRIVRDHVEQLELERAVRLGRCPHAEGCYLLDAFVLAGQHAVTGDMEPHIRGKRVEQSLGISRGEGVVERA